MSSGNQDFSRKKNVLIPFILPLLLKSMFEIYSYGPDKQMFCCVKCPSCVRTGPAHMYTPSHITNQSPYDFSYDFSQQIV